MSKPALVNITTATAVVVVTTVSTLLLHAYVDGKLDLLREKLEHQKAEIEIVRLNLEKYQKNTNQVVQVAQENQEQKQPVEPTKQHRQEPVHLVNNIVQVALSEFKESLCVLGNNTFRVNCSIKRLTLSN